MVLSKSALKPWDEVCKIIDIAMEMGFGSVDGYQRAFFREFGCNPHKYVTSPIPLYLFTPYGVKYSAKRKEKVMENVKNVFIQVIEEPVRKVLIKRGVNAADYFAYCEEVAIDYQGAIPDGFDVIELPAAKYLMFKGEPFSEEEYCEAIEQVQGAIAKYDPAVIGCTWDKANPPQTVLYCSQKAFLKHGLKQLGV